MFIASHPSLAHALPRPLLSLYLFIMRALVLTGSHSCRYVYSFSINTCGNSPAGTHTLLWQAVSALSAQSDLDVFRSIGVVTAVADLPDFLRRHLMLTELEEEAENDADHSSDEEEGEALSVCGEEGYALDCRSPYLLQDAVHLAPGALQQRRVLHLQQFSRKRTFSIGDPSSSEEDEGDEEVERVVQEQQRQPDGTAVLSNREAPETVGAGYCGCCKTSNAEDRVPCERCGKLACGPCRNRRKCHLCGGRDACPILKVRLNVLAEVTSLSEDIYISLQHKSLLCPSRSLL